jgi:hypothetical protein
MSAESKVESNMETMFLQHNNLTANNKQQTTKVKDEPKKILVHTISTTMKLTRHYVPLNQTKLVLLALSTIAS